MSSIFETLLCEVQDGIATLTLNRPAALNAMNRRMADELGLACRTRDRRGPGLRLLRRRPDPIAAELRVGAETLRAEHPNRLATRPTSRADEG